MKFGDRLTGTITHLDDHGRGVFAYQLPQAPEETRDVVVPFALVGDTIEATFVKRDKGHWVGRLERVTAPSPDRVTAPCPHAGTCGGCLWQHLAYDAQLVLKRDAINAALANAGHVERVEAVLPSTDQLHFRNRMDYVVGWKKEVGLKEYGSWNRYIDLSTCLLLDDETPHILADVRRLMDEQGFLPWDAKKQTGDLRYCVIRLGRNTGERLITLLVKDLTRFTPEIREAITATLAPRCTSLYLGENPEITDLSLAKTLVSLHGPAYLTEEVNGLRYRIHPNSFFQTNTRMAATLQQTVLDLALAKQAPNSKFLDLYCGLGFFGIAAAARGATVYGHELDAPAIELAKQNAELNGVGARTRFAAGPVEKLDWAAETPDVVLVDPPRAGLHPRAVETLLKNAPPTIVYVSCNYHRLVEELKTLKTGYRVTALQALDLFPQTPHVEVVAKLEKIA
jgi:23S rRNA (uracil-5-)-methyltransferase RumA